MAPGEIGRAYISEAIKSRDRDLLDIQHFAVSKRDQPELPPGLIGFSVQPPGEGLVIPGPTYSSTLARVEMEA